MGDLNGDGKPDLVLGVVGLRTMVGKGDGTFVPGGVESSNYGVALSLGDITGDGVLDVASLGGFEVGL